MPNTTKGFLAVANANHLAAQWRKTQLGQLLKDPVMEPFAKDILRQFDDELSGLRAKLGVTLEDLRGIAAGELAVAVIAATPEEAALALIVDVTGKQQGVFDLLKKVAASVERQGGKAQPINMLGINVPVSQYDLPKPKNAAKAKQQTAFHCLAGNYLIASNHRETLIDIFGRITAGRPGSLSQMAEFQKVMQRCANDAKGAMPQIRWYADVIGYADVTRAALAEEDRRKGKSVAQILRDQGFDAVQGVGGFVDLAVQDPIGTKYELIHRTAILTTPQAEFRKAMKMCAFPNIPRAAEQGWGPQPWVPRDVATYVTFNLDINTAFDNFGWLFDEIVEEEGVWQDVLESLQVDTQIDLKKDLIQQLASRVTVITDYREPIGPESERLLVAVEVKDPIAVEKALEKIFGPDMTTEAEQWDGHLPKVWVAAEEDGPPVQQPSLGGVPLPGVVDDEEEDAVEKLLPHSAITVGHGALLISSHRDFLAAVLQPRATRATLARNPDYARVAEILNKQGIPDRCAWSFALTDEKYRPTYEMIRAGKMPVSRSVLGRILNAILVNEQTDRTVRQQAIDGKSLPEFDAVRRYLGPAGLIIATEPTGWFLKGFTLHKQPQ